MPPQISRAVGMDDRLDRCGSGLEHVLHPVLVRHRAEHADECHLVCDRMEFFRNILGIFVGTAGIVGFAFCKLSVPLRIAFGAAALAILIPQHAFVGADLLDWIGLGSAIAVLSINFVQSRTTKQTPAPNRLGRDFLLHLYVPKTVSALMKCRSEY